MAIKKTTKKSTGHTKNQAVTKEEKRLTKRGKLFITIDLCSDVSIDEDVIKNSTITGGDHDKLEILFPDGCNWEQARITNVIF